MTALATLAALAAAPRAGAYALHGHLYTHARACAPLFGLDGAELRRRVCRDAGPLGGDDARVAPFVRRALTALALAAGFAAPEVAPSPPCAPPAPPSRVWVNPRARRKLTRAAARFEAERGAIAAMRTPVETPENAPTRRRRAPRLPRAAYRDARATRQGLAPDTIEAFDAVWRGLWPDRGRATLAERFAEWCEAHPDELLAHTVDAAERRTRRMLREHARYERIEREAIEGGDHAAA